MQLCTIYKSSKKSETYLFIETRDDFSAVPEPLMALLGTPILVMTLDLSQRQSLAQADLSKVRTELTSKGYYLQLPPPVENLLEAHKKQNNYQERD